jgi:hypothetical protein
MYMKSKEKKLKLKKIEIAKTGKAIGGGCYRIGNNEAGEWRVCCFSPWDYICSY